MKYLIAYTDEQNQWETKITESEDDVEAQIEFEKENPKCKIDFVLNITDVDEEADRFLKLNVAPKSGT